jgi:hypothetical protein
MKRFFELEINTIVYLRRKVRSIIAGFPNGISPDHPWEPFSVAAFSRSTPDKRSFFSASVSKTLRLTFKKYFLDSDPVGK